MLTHLKVSPHEDFLHGLKILRILGQKLQRSMALMAMNGGLLVAGVSLLTKGGSNGLGGIVSSLMQTANTSNWKQQTPVLSSNEVRG